MGAGLLGLAIAILASSQMWMALPPAVGVEIAALAPVTRVLAVNGRIAAVHSVDIRSAVSGKLAALPVAEGDLVEAGQTLAQVDAAAQNSIVRQAKAGLDAALVTQQQAVEAYDRAVALGNNVARTVLEDTAHGVQSAAQEVARMTAFLDQASSVLRDHATRAPIAGSVVDLYVERGQIVGPSTPLLTLADLNDLVVEADVDEAYATQIDVMQPAVMQLPGETGTHDGHVSFVSTRVNASTGGLAVKIAFEAPVMLPIGLTVATNIVVDRRDAALTAPRTAIMTSEKGTEVFVVVDGTAHRRAVTVVEWPAARLIVTAGLVEGDMMVTDATGIKDGQAVALDLP
jgi:RND family efflux transporter MFP subunit